MAIQLWATNLPYSGVGTLTGYKGAEVSIGTLQGGFFLSNVARTATINVSSIPSGTYNIVFVLAEWNGFEYVTVDYGNFPTRQTFGVVASPPGILISPQNITLVVGQTGTFTVSATGTSPFAYQWRKNGVVIGGATSAALLLSNVQIADAGTYTVSISNSVGAVTSSGATLIVVAAVTAPQISTGPLSQTLTAGGDVSFSVSVSGTGPLAFQWRKNGASIPNATLPNYSIANVQLSDSAAYSVVVSNSAGSVTSAAASLTVIPAGPSARLSNLSVRTTMASGQTLIVGVVVTGGARDILVRAVGPALAAFGLSTAMTDPRLELYNGSSLVFSNDDWPATLASTFTSVGAFGLPVGSRDAAFVRSVEGAYSIQARGTGAGVVLVEAYDLGTGNSPRMVNVSARNRVGTGDDILIAGFNIAGTGTKQLLFRAVGPGLAAFGVTGTLVDPKLEIYSGGTKVTENDNWTPTLAATFSAVGAFGLPAGSRDAALLTTLAPGTYSVQVSGVGGGTGEALVEIYEVP
ncbi:MAG: hypothetical protein EXS37_07285 [Opitutus sp.]|nr:hypothetical protein [Opitutus sp.]